MLSMSFLSILRRFSTLAVVVVGVGFLANVSVGTVHAQESTLADQTLTQECIDQAYSGTIHQSSDADLALEIEICSKFTTRITLFHQKRSDIHQKLFVKIIQTHPF